MALCAYMLTPIDTPDAKAWVGFAGWPHFPHIASRCPWGRQCHRAKPAGFSWTLHVYPSLLCAPCNLYLFDAANCKHENNTYF